MSKQTLDQRSGNTPFGKFPINRRAIGSRTSFASVKYFHYSKQNFGTASNLEQGAPTNTELYGVNIGVIEDEIASMKIQKNIGQAAGTFELRLLPSKNWKQILSPGDWVAIYMYDRYQSRDQKGKDDDTKNLIMLANIDRVARSLQKDEKGDKVQLSFTVSGRSFGKVLEETDIWFDPASISASQEDIALRTSGLEMAGNPSNMVRELLNIFLGSGGTIKKTEPLNQWRIPTELARLFKADKAVHPQFDHILKRQIEPNLPGFKVRAMLSPDSSGSVWTMLERSHNSLVNEVFLEEVRDDEGKAYPTIICRPRPLNTPSFMTGVKPSQFGKDDAALRPFLNGKYETLQHLSNRSFVEISPAEILYEDLGKDDHSRINFLWLRPQQVYEYAYSRQADNNIRGLANPTINLPSMTRYGLKRYDQLMDFSYVEQKSTTGGTSTNVATPGPNINLFKAMMAQVYDMNYANHLYDAGTISCSGVLEAELGKALVIKADPQVKTSIDKIFYIEGYTHEWTFPSMWRTTFTVTHGQFRSPNGIFIDALGKGDQGQADTLITNTYLSKTKTEKK